jgi:hypothetical protein
MGNCFTLVYVLQEGLASDNNSLNEFSRLIDESDEFLDNFFNNFEVEAPDYLIDKVMNIAKSL